MVIGQDKVGLSVRDETIGRLYALRAGLSVVAKEKDKADRIMRDAEMVRSNAYKMAQGEIDRVVRNEEDINIEIEEAQQNVDKMKDDYDNCKRTAESSGLIGRIFSAMPSILILVLMLLSCAYFLGVIAFFSIGSPAKSDNTFIRLIYGYLDSVPVLSEFYIYFGIAAVIVTIIYIVKYLRYRIRPIIRVSAKYKAKKELPSKAFELQKAEKLLNEARKKLEINKELLKKAERKLPERRNLADADYLHEKEKATEHAVAGLAVIDALDDTFGDMIDIRDWENTDILIYALETRRAENMKEALSVVDGERRTERIVEAVNTAGQEICKSINTGLRRLQGEMTRCFGVLGQLVALQGDRISEQLQGLGAGIAANNSYIAQLTSQQSMTNALMAKANENSAAIAEEVARLRTSAEYSDARLLYGTR